MRHFFIAGLVFVVLLPQVLRASLPNAQIVVEKINEERTSRGLQALSEDSRLGKAAIAKAFEIKEKEALTHTTGFPWSYLSSAGYIYDYAGENLALNVLTSDELVNGWMDSSSHRENILNSSFRDIGVAIVSGEYQGEASDYIVAYFGKQKSLVLIPPVSGISANVTEVSQNSLQVALIRELIALLTQYLLLLPH